VVLAPDAGVSPRLADALDAAMTKNHLNFIAMVSAVILAENTALPETSAI
jgi:hypothetical protein